MSTPIIEVQKLSKVYRLGTIGATTLRESFHHCWSRLRGHPEPDAREFWALRDVSFAVQPGEVVGIIGRNGAGKSTLLKILSRITEPTIGRIGIRGRVASLLEVGTGFHPDLTGRENIFLNGAILGMSRPEIRKKFDEIVAFAEIEKFLDTPVKRYSSGMYVRLAFAVAAHLEPEILIVDEVLAVGDAEFQKKCLGRMQDIAMKESRTILFVSHNMNAVRTLCSRGILLQSGQIGFDGGADEALSSYIAEVGKSQATPLHLESVNGELEISGITICSSGDTPKEVFRPGDDLCVAISYHARTPVREPHFWVSVESKFGSLFGANMLLDGHCPKSLSGTGVVRVRFPRPALMPQQSYIVWLGARESNGSTVLLKSVEAGTFRVEGMSGDLDLHGKHAEHFAANSSPVVMPYAWQFADGEEIWVRPGQDSVRPGSR